MRPSVSNWTSSTAVHFKRGKAAGFPHSRKKKRHFSCRFHPRRMRQPYGLRKRSSRITWSQQAAAGTPYHMNISAGRLISGQQRNAWRFFTTTIILIAEHITMVSKRSIPSIFQFFPCLQNSLSIRRTCGFHTELPFILASCNDLVWYVVRFKKSFSILMIVDKS